MQTKYLAPATSNSIKLAKFFDRVLENKFSKATQKSSLYSIQTEKNKLNELIGPNSSINSKFHANKIK